VVPDLVCNAREYAELDPRMVVDQGVERAVTGEWRTMNVATVEPTIPSGTRSPRAP